MNTVLALCYLATWAAIPHLLWLKKRPAATLAWLWAILFIPFAGALVYCLFGTDRLKRRRLKHRARFSARPSRQPAPTSATDEATAALIRNLSGADRRFLQLLSRINQLPASSAESLRILRAGDHSIALLITNQPLRFIEFAETLPLVYVAASPDPTLALRFRRCRVLRKPFPPADLVECVAELAPPSTISV